MARTKRQKKSTETTKRKPTKAGVEQAAIVDEPPVGGFVDEGAQLTMQLAEKAIHGDSNSREVIDSRSDQASGEAVSEASFSGFSQALAWEAEPQWQGEPSEEAAATALACHETGKPA